MPSSFYILLLLNLSSFGAYALFPEIFEGYSDYLALILIGLLGIPHGAMDHLLVTVKVKNNPRLFYFLYLTSIFVYVSVWYFFPLFSLLFFLILSAFHFGQSQFNAKTLRSRKNIEMYTGFAWGTFLLSIFIFLNIEEIIAFNTIHSDLAVLNPLFKSNHWVFFMGVSSFIYILLSWFALSVKNWIIELLYVALIISTFYFQPLFLGFTLFFVCTHSFEVMKTEFQFLKRLKNKISILRFIQILIPLTTLSFVGTFMLFLMSYYEIISASFPFIVLVVISTITFPHVIVMHLFYTKQHRY